MIHGSVSAAYAITIPVSVRDSVGQEQAIDTVLDTGFTAFLSLPTSVIAGLGLPWHGKTKAILAGGKVVEYDVYIATVMWNGAPRSISVQAIDNDALLGMRLLIGHDLWARILPGGPVTIDAVP